MESGPPGPLFAERPLFAVQSGRRVPPVPLGIRPSPSVRYRMIVGRAPDRPVDEISKSLPALAMAGWVKFVWLGDAVHHRKTRERRSQRHSATRGAAEWNL